MNLATQDGRVCIRRRQSGRKQLIAAVAGSECSPVRCWLPSMVSSAYKNLGRVNLVTHAHEIRREFSFIVSCPLHCSETNRANGAGAIERLGAVLGPRKTRQGKGH